VPYVTVGIEHGAPIQVHYQGHGHGDPVVLIHGYPLDGTSCDRQESTHLKLRLVGGPAGQHRVSLTDLTTIASGVPRAVRTVGSVLAGQATERGGRKLGWIEQAPELVLVAQPAAESVALGLELAADVPTLDVDVQNLDPTRSPPPSRGRLPSRRTGSSTRRVRAGVRRAATDSVADLRGIGARVDPTDLRQHRRGRSWCSSRAPSRYAPMSFPTSSTTTRKLRPHCCRSG
jgi:hypothetical protein